MVVIGIYQLVHKDSGKRYIGQSVHTEIHRRDHFSALRRNIHPNVYLQSAWNKYGEKAFEYSVLEECTKEQLDEREIYWIAFYRSTEPEFGYNLRKGGTWFTEESRQSISTSLKGRKKPEGFGEKLSKARKGNFTKAQKEKLAQAASDWWKTATPEQIEARKKHQSEAGKGRIVSEEQKEQRRKNTTDWWANATEEERIARCKAIKENQHFTEERGKKIGDALRGRRLGPLPQETKDKISKSLTGRKVQVDTSPEAVARRSESQKKVMADTEARKKLSDAVRARYQDPKVREQHRRACIDAMERRKQRRSQNI